MYTLYTDLLYSIIVDAFACVSLVTHNYILCLVHSVNINLNSVCAIVQLTKNLCHIVHVLGRTMYL